MVVTPNRRLARFLHRDFDLAQRARGLTAWPTPSILPYPQWLEALWAEAVAADAMTDAALLLTPAQSTLQWRRLVEADEAAVGARLLGDGGTVVLVDVGDHNAGTQVTELAGGRRPDAAGCARDQDHLAGKIHVTPLPLGRAPYPVC